MPDLAEALCIAPTNPAAVCEAVEQTCRLRQLSGSGGKYFLPVSGVDQGHSRAKFYRPETVKRDDTRRRRQCEGGLTGYHPINYCEQDDVDTT